VILPLSPASKGLAKSQTAMAKGQRHWLRARLLDSGQAQGHAREPPRLSRGSVRSTGQ